MSLVPRNSRAWSRRQKPLSGCRVSSGVTLEATSGALAAECRKESDEMYEDLGKKFGLDRHSLKDCWRRYKLAHDL